VLAVDDPAFLLAPDTAGVPVCTPDQIIDSSCDASRAAGGIFTSRPIGGTRVVEGNVELRVAVGRDFEVVTFGDFGEVWGDGETFDLADLEFTPGVGVRYLSPIGPIRVDLGYSFRGDERLSVVTRQIAPYGGDCSVTDSPCLLVPGDAMRIPYVETGELAVLPSVLFGESESRFQLHLSIGQAF
jgi:hypothetical protein